MGFHAVNLALGEAPARLADPETGAMSYGWLCGCRASTHDALNYTLTPCETHCAQLEPM